MAKTVQNSPGSMLPIKMLAEMLLLKEIFDDAMHFVYSRAHYKKRLATIEQWLIFHAEHRNATRRQCYIQDNKIKGLVREECLLPFKRLSQAYQENIVADMTFYKKIVSLYTSHDER